MATFTPHLEELIYKLSMLNFLKLRDNTKIFLFHILPEIPSGMYVFSEGDSDELFHSKHMRTDARPVHSSFSHVCYF